MNETGAARVLTGTQFEFPRYYSRKDFICDSSRLRDLLRKPAREPLTPDEISEVSALRRRIRKIDADVAMLLVIEHQSNGGYRFY